MKTLALSGLDLLPTAVVLVDAQLTVRYLNSAAENLFEIAVEVSHSKGWSTISRSLSGRWVTRAPTIAATLSTSSSWA